MRLELLPIGDKVPDEFNVVIEVPVGGPPVKYELDKESGALTVDRFLHTAMTYPCNYGFIPHTKSADGDPVDVPVVSRIPVVPGCVMKCRPIGVLLMTDEAGQDEKILAVPIEKLNPYYTTVFTYLDLPAILTKRIEHFFEHYKDLEPDKWVKIDRWGGPEEAKELILKGVALAESEKSSDHK